VWAATYGAGGRLILTADAAGAQVWNAANGTRIARLPMGGDNYRGTIRLSLDGRLALTPGGDDGDVWVWDVAKRRRVATLPGDGRSLKLALFSDDGRRIATIDTRSVRVWADGRPIAVFRPRRVAISDADFSADGRRVVTAAGAEAEVWDVPSGRRIALLPNGAFLASAQFDRSGRYVVTGDYSGVARVWEVSSGRAISVLRGHTEAVRRARFSPGGTRIVTISDDGSARLWPTRARTPTDPRWRHADSTTFAPDSRHVLLAQGRRRGVWDVKTGKVVELRGGIYETDSSSWPCGRAAGCAPWSPDGRLVAGADARGRAVIWDARSGAVRRRIGPATGTVIGVAFSPDGRHVAVVDGERSAARLWTLGGKDPVLVPGPRSRGSVLQSAQFVTDPLRVLTVDFDGVARLSDPATGASVTLPGETRPRAVAASSDGQQVATATSNGQLHVFSGRDAKVRSVRASKGPISSVAWALDGSALATGGQEGTVRIWDASTLTPTDLRAPGGTVADAAFSPDGRLLLVTSGSIARLWDRSLPGIVLEVPNVADVSAELSPDATELVIAGTRTLEARPCFACASLDELERDARTLLPADG
jgi:WD40 repeat protein